MKELRELTRSAHHLMVFEAAARNQSFTVAAHELNVTQPAVSRSVLPLAYAETVVESSPPESRVTPMLTIRRLIYIQRTG